MSNKEIARIGKNAAEEIIVALTNYKGKDLVDVRVWNKATGDKAEIPTKKGLSLRIELLPEIIEALTQADKTYQDDKGKKVA